MSFLVVLWALGGDPLKVVVFFIREISNCIFRGLESEFKCGVYTQFRKIH